MSTILAPSAPVRARPPQPGTLEILAVPPADAARIGRLIGSARFAIGAAAVAVVVDAMAALPAAAVARIRGLARRHPGRLAVVVDRMDDAGCEYVVFDARRRWLLEAGVAADVFIPAISAFGEGIVSGPDRLDWYRGPTLAYWLAGVHARSAAGRREDVR